MQNVKFILVGLFISTHLFVSAQSVKDQMEMRPLKKAKVLLLGVPHFANPNLDVINTKVDDVLSEKRQQELVVLTQLLARFKPTKIAIEARPIKAQSINNKYHDYLKGKHQLIRNESEQIGFRLAKMLNHDTIYCVDMSNNWFIDSLMQYAALHNQANLLQGVFQKVTQAIEEEEGYLRNHSISDYLYRTNDPKRIVQSNGFYLSTFTKVGEDKSYIGSELVADWYQRNLKIFTNIVRVAKADDRILVIFGYGHIRLLQHFFEDSFDFEVINSRDYLK